MSRRKQIVEKLRAYGREPGVPPEGAYELALAAANEIERLQFALQQIKIKAADGMDIDTCSTGVLNDIYEQAREALK